MKVDFAARELTIKLVYYGPALSGKTTNLRAIHWLATPKTCGELMTLETQNDRTLFFDMLPVTVNSDTGLKVRVKLFTVPGQVMHNATRRLVLQGADGVVFVADSRISEAEANRTSFTSLQENLHDAGIDPSKLPIVIQFNKRDLDNIRSDEELEALSLRSKEPIYKAVATRGFGVMHTFRGLVRRTWYKLEQEHGLEEKFAIAPLQFLSEIESKLRHDPTMR
jgi:signal recognition particle receptor subunit beta